MRTIRRCPSGALSYVEGGAAQTYYHDTPEIEIARDGPYHVRGGVELKGIEAGQGASGEHIALCRCGQSRNKPFCDGSHWYAGFKDDEARTISAANRASEAGEEAWIAVGAAGGLAPDRVHSLTVGERQVALVRRGGTWYALDGRGPHQGGPLTDGTLCDGALALSLARL